MYYFACHESYARSNILEDNSKQLHEKYKRHADVVPGTEV
jgi:hypothetical protein